MSARNEKDPGAAQRPASRRAKAGPGWELVLPRGAAGVVVIFARTARGGGADETVEEVARALHGAGIGTAAVDPAPDDTEEGGREHRFEIGAMAGRLEEAVDRLARERRTRALPVGCLASGTAG
ncbi:MAG TPA: hypothetical protein VFR37_10915, partial [Longimicrobium sp.]|nr:hypothetical protein [Longimicrobium sp.]